jgi:hypothetical protein
MVWSLGRIAKSNTWASDLQAVEAEALKIAVGVGSTGMRVSGGRPMDGQPRVVVTFHDGRHLSPAHRIDGVRAVRAT